LDKVLAGIKKSLEAGFTGVKLNVVLLKDINHAEAAAFAKLSVDQPLDVRFIEYFPTNDRSGRLAGALYTTAQTKQAIEAALGPLTRLPPKPGGGPASIYALAGAKGKIGFISGRSDNFCGACNRIRLDCTGKVYPCLFSPATHNLRDLLRSGADDAALTAYVKKIFLVKSNYKKDSPSAGNIEMSSIGG